MSWNVAVFACNTPPPPSGEMPPDFKLEILGSASEVREKISACFPATDWKDPAWGHFDGDGYGVAFNIGEEDPVESIGLRIVGSGDVVARLLELSEKSGWYLFDTSTGEWLHQMSDADEGWQEFQAYRNRVMGKRSAE